MYLGYHIYDENGQETGACIAAGKNEDEVMGKAMARFLITIGQTGGDVFDAVSVVEKDIDMEQAAQIENACIEFFGL